ncbi:hypothetical protein [Streptomyces sp. NPDC054756]
MLTLVDWLSAAAAAGPGGYSRHPIVAVLKKLSVRVDKPMEDWQTSTRSSWRTWVVLVENPLTKSFPD